MSTNKTLVIILGETGSNANTFSNIKHNVIDPLGADLCLCVSVTPDYDYNNPYYAHARYKFLHEDPIDYGRAFEQAYNAAARTRPKYEKFENTNSLNGQIEHMKKSSDTITYHGLFNHDKAYLPMVNRDEIVVFGNKYPSRMWRNRTYSSNTSEYNTTLTPQDRVTTYKKHLHWTKFMSFGGKLFGGVHEANQSGSDGIALFYRWFLLKNLIDRNILDMYDRFVITRGDFLFKIAHPSMTLLDPQYVWFPNGEQYGGYNSRHVVLSKENIVQYLNIFNNMVDKSNEFYIKMQQCGIDAWNIEKMIRFNLSFNGVTDDCVKTFPYIMCVVNNKDKNGNFQGTYNKMFACHVKYTNEHILSDRFRKIVKRTKPQSMDEFYSTHMS